MPDCKNNTDRRSWRWRGLGLLLPNGKILEQSSTTGGDVSRRFMSIPRRRARLAWHLRPLVPPPFGQRLADRIVAGAADRADR